jgi:hypothetical protein
MAQQIQAERIQAAGGTVKIFQRAYLRFERPLSVNGALSVERVITLPRNAVVLSPFIATVEAGPADWATAASVAHIRHKDISGDRQDRTSVVVDFGVMRTVAGVALTDTWTLQVLQVKSWAGTAFAPVPIASGVGDGELSALTIDASTAKLETTLGAEVPFSSEIKTDRLQIDLIGKGDDEQLGKTLLVQLPDLPADLDLKINGGAPVWSAPGAVAAPPPGATTAPPPGWTTAPDGLLQQKPDIAAALSAMLGDPSADKSATLDQHVVLAARNPGALELNLPDRAVWRLRYVANVALPSDTLTFAAEGALSIALKLPDYAARLERVSFTAIGNLPPERVIPPVGPDAAIVPGGTGPLAELLLDHTHSACVAIPQAGGFGEITALRFPLRVEQGGAEMHVALVAADTDGTPGVPIQGAITKPVTLDASGDESWTTFTLARPFSIDHTALYYAMAVVRRGRVRWALTGSPTPSAGQVFTGPPAGPWQPLPPLGELAALRGRVRVVGHARRELPLAPILVEINGSGGSGSEITPVQKGVAVQLSEPQAGLPASPDASHLVSLVITSRVAGSITLRDVVVTVAQSGGA